MHHQDTTEPALRLPLEFALADSHGAPGLVSVVIPAYNRGYVVAKAVQSALDQQGVTVEVIVVDDGSADDTADVAAACGPAVRVLRQANAGVSAARNAGLQASRGEFVALLDSDDTWLPWKLSAQLAVMRRWPEVGMVWSDMSALDPQGHLLQQAYLRTFYTAHRRVRLEDVLLDAGELRDYCAAAQGWGAARVLRGDLFSAMFLGNLVHTSTVLLRRSRLAAAGGFDTRLRRSGEDYEFHLRTCSLGPVAYIDAPSTLYRTGAADQLTLDEYGVDMARNTVATLHRWLVAAGTRVTLEPQVLRARLATVYGWLGEEEFRRGRVADARRHLARGLHRGTTARQACMLAMTCLPSPLLRALAGGRRAMKHLAKRELPHEADA